MFRSPALSLHTHRALLPPFFAGTPRNVANELAVAGRSGGGTPEAYHGAVERALAELEPFKADIETSIQMQEPLLEQIFAENERYVCDRREEGRCRSCRKSVGRLVLDLLGGRHRSCPQRISTVVGEARASTLVLRYYLLYSDPKESRCFSSKPPCPIRKTLVCFSSKPPSGPRFQKARASDRETLDREAFLQKVHGAVMLFHEVHAQLSEGAMFYSDLLQRLAQLNQTCEDLVRLGVGIAVEHLVDSNVHGCALRSCTLCHHSVRNALRGACL